MTLFVTNTLTGEREPFEPGDPDSVLLYYCGLTVSDFAHLGHARGWIHTDVMHRWLEHLGYDVHHVENFTDVNEKIAARVGEDDLGDSEADVARTFITQVIRDMRDLNLKRADVYPRVSEHVPDIVDLIETLVEKGYAYESNGSVYFDVTSFEDYGKLSNQMVEEMEAQGESDERGEKRHPGDFALWKADGVSERSIEEHRNPDTEYSVSHPPGETWESPWGEGRPGWHIECSAMSMKHLGETIDIHVGGQDLVFPHHENEVAQSEAATGHQFARYWLHVRLLETDGEKMSSSLGNYSTVRGAISEIGANAVRMFLLSTSYANRQTFSDETVSEAEERWDRLSDGYDRAVDALDSPDARTTVEDDELRGAVDDDTRGVHRRDERRLQHPSGVSRPPRSRDGGQPPRGRPRGVRLRRPQIGRRDLRGTRRRCARLLAGRRDGRRRAPRRGPRGTRSRPSGERAGRRKLRTRRRAPRRLTGTRRGRSGFRLRSFVQAPVAIGFIPGA